jgi:hypothetical protein
MVDDVRYFAGSNTVLPCQEVASPGVSIVSRVLFPSQKLQLLNFTGFTFLLPARLPISPPLDLKILLLNP